MDSTRIVSLLEELDDQIDDLEEALSPITKATLISTASKLPVLDKAKLHVLVTYAIESILFSYLRLHGVKAKEHPVFRELTRVKQYFDKIKAAETPPETAKRDQALDKGAAKRFIAAGLSGNDQYDLARAEQLAKEKAKAQLKLQDLERKRKAALVEKEDDSDSTSSSDSDSDSEEAESVEEVKAPKKQKSVASAATAEPVKSSKNKQQRKNKKQVKKRAKKA